MQHRCDAQPLSVRLQHWLQQPPAWAVAASAASVGCKGSPASCDKGGSILGRGLLEAMWWRVWLDWVVFLSEVGRCLWNGAVVDLTDDSLHGADDAVHLSCGGSECRHAVEEVAHRAEPYTEL